MYVVLRMFFIMMWAAFDGAGFRLLSLIRSELGENGYSEKQSSLMCK